MVKSTTHFGWGVRYKSDDVAGPVEEVAGLIKAAENANAEANMEGVAVELLGSFGTQRHIHIVQ